MARASTSQDGPADLPELVERLHAGGDSAVGDFTQEELETVIDDLPLALESESIRDHLPALVSRIEQRLERTFRRIIEIARQDEERTGLLLTALSRLAWSGTPTEDEFAWLVQQMSRHPEAGARLAAFERAASLTLHAAQVAILDALGSIHPDESIRNADHRRREAAAAPDAEQPAETTAELVSAQEAARREDMQAESRAEEPGSGSPPPVETAWEDPGSTALSRPAGDEAEDASDAGEPTPDESTPEGEPVYDESQAPAESWNREEEKPPDRLTVRTLLRSLEAPPVANLAAREAGEDAAGAPAEPERPADDETTVADDEPTPQVENSLTDEGEAIDAGDEGIADESSSPEAAAAATYEEPAREPITVRTLLSSLDTVLLSNAPGEEEPVPAFPEEGNEVWNETETPPERVTVMTMLRSLETVRVKMAALEEGAGAATDGEGGAAALAGAGTAAAEPATAEPPAPASPAPEADATASNGAAEEPQPSKPEPKPWSEVDLKPLTPPDRARRLSKVRRELASPELKRGYLAWLFDREKDAFSVVSIRKEILEFAFERSTFLGFVAATRARLGRWIRERAAADQVAPAPVLAALRRATWAEGEPPQVDDETRAIVDAATGTLARVPSEERAALFNRDFTAWLFSIREFEDREVLDKYARDPHPGVAEGLFRALAAMDGLAARFGGNAGQSALEIALGVWDRADNETRTELAKAIAAGWSRGLVLDRRAFFDAFWKRHEAHEAQRPAILIALASFEKEIENAQAKSAGAATPTPVPEATAEAPRAQEDAPHDGGRATSDAERRATPAPPPAAPTAPPAEPSAEVTAKPAAPPPRAFQEDTTDSDEGTDRFFRMMRKNMEAGMRAGASPPRVEEPEPTVPEEGDAEEGVLPDEGDVVLEGSGPKPAPAPAAAKPPGDSRDEEVVLPGEPLRSLAEYTRFLRSLSAGRPIDELLGEHGMDYKQYAACMTAWGRLLQNRPDLALRMGQLLRNAG